MKKILLMCTLILAAMMALSGCGNAGGGGESGSGSSSSGTATETPYVENDGLKLSYPAEYEDLLDIETPQNDKDGMLFTVSEKASMEAAKEMGSDVEGAGWLFSIGRIDEDTLHQRLTGEMSGQQVFGKDGDGNYYVYYHPTDVRLIRKDNKAMEEAEEQWTALCDWAATVPDTFLAENGLTEEKYGNTDLDILLARVAYDGDTNYTLTRLDPEPLKPGKVDPKEYIGPLLTGVTYEDADLKEVPDGEYLVLNFPDEDTRVDFFVADGNYIRIVQGDNETLYKAVFTDDSIVASDLVQKWHDALEKEA